MYSDEGQNWGLPAINPHVLRETFREVVRSVAEPLPHEVKGVAPRVLWDRVNDRLHARRGTRFLALTSGGRQSCSGR